MKQPKLEDYGLADSEVDLISCAIEKGERVNKCLSWFLYFLSILGGLLAWKIVGGLIGLAAFFGLLLIGLQVSDSKRLIKFWNYRNRDLIEGFYQFEIASARYVRWHEKTRREYWDSLSGREFEFEIAALFRNHDYNVEVTPASGDKGVDIAMTKGDKLTIVQCKRHKRPVNPAVVRELYGALLHTGADEAILVCTAGFTSGVYDFAQDKPIELIGMDDIIRLQNTVAEISEVGGVTPYHVWLQTWLQSHSDHPNIEDSLDSYIKHYDLMSSSQDEADGISERRTKCALLEAALKHTHSSIRESIEEHLLKSQRLFALYEELAEVTTRLDKGFAESRANRDLRDQFEPSDAQDEVDYINAELENIHMEMRAGRLHTQDALTKLDQLEERLNRLEE